MLAVYPNLVAQGKKKGDRVAVELDKRRKFIHPVKTIFVVDPAYEADDRIQASTDDEDDIDNTPDQPHADDAQPSTERQLSYESLPESLRLRLMLSPFNQQIVSRMKIGRAHV